MRDDDSFESKSSQIRQLASLSPEQLSDHLSRLHNTLDSGAPQIAPHLYSTAANAIQFLNSKLPPGGNELPEDGPSPLPASQKRTWLDLHEAVNKPLSVLDHVREGTFNSGHLQALQSVYPDLHQEMVQKVIDHVGELKQKGVSIPYSKRMALSQFIGRPLDSTLTPPSFQAILSSSSGSTQGSNQGAQKAPKKASGVELKQINQVSELSQTPLQAREAHKALGK